MSRIPGPFRLIASLLSFATTSTSAAAQTHDVTYDWQTQSLTNARDVVAGRTISVEFANLNLVCYDYAITMEQVAAIESNKDFLAAFVGQLSSGETQSEQPAIAYEAPAKQAAELFAFKMMIPADVKDAVERLDRVINEYEKGRNALRVASQTLGMLSEKRNLAKQALEKFYIDACIPNKGRDRSIVGAAWRVASKAPEDLVTEVTSRLSAVEANISSAKRALAEAVILFGRIRRDASAQFLSDNQGKLRDRADLHAALAIAIEDASKTASQLRTESTAAHVASTEIADALTSPPRILSVTLQESTGTVTGSIVATGKPGIPHLKEVELKNTFEIPVYRRFRAFLSTGFIKSSLNEHKFERQNLPGPDDTTTYSTFVDMRSARSLAFAPAVFSHMTLGSLADFGLTALTGVSVAVSGGVAARSVNARISPDFLLGASLGVRDRVMLTAAWHTGRVEHLIIGNPEEVRKSAVPTEITREGAVGERWRSGFAIAFSVSM